MPTPPPDRQDGIDVTGGGQPPTGDPFLDEALREAVDDYQSGISRSASWIMERADEIFEQRYPDAGDNLYREHISRDDAIAMVSTIVDGHKRSGGWVDKGTFEEEVESQVSLNLAAGGWIHVSAVGDSIEKMARKISAEQSRDHARVTLRVYRNLLLAMVNCGLMICLPMPYKAAYGLCVCIFGLWMANRISREMNTMIKKAEAEIALPIDATNRSTQLAESIVANRGIKRSTFDICDEVKTARIVKSTSPLLSTEVVNNLRQKINLSPRKPDG